MTNSTRFATPSLNVIVEDEEFNEHRVPSLKAYMRKIVGLNRLRWILILEAKMSKDIVDQLDSDEMYEAYAAFTLFQAEKDKQARQAAKK